jgi:adenosine kinase
MSSGVVVNAYEWSLMKERLGCTEENIALLTPLLIVTQGESGLVLYSAEETCSVQACKATSVINPTGAGDAFRAGLLAGLGSKWPLLHAARLGACMGSFAVEQEGTLIDMFDKEEAWERMRQTYGEEMPVLT